MLATGFGGTECPEDSLTRRVVAAHGIEGDAHRSRFLHRNDFAVRVIAAIGAHAMRLLDASQRGHVVMPGFLSALCERRLRRASRNAFVWKSH